jgi:hypothetical protein
MKIPLSKSFHHVTTFSGTLQVFYRQSDKSTNFPHKMRMKNEAAGAALGSPLQRP